MHVGTCACLVEFPTTRRQLSSYPLRCRRVKPGIHVFFFSNIEPTCTRLLLYGYPRTPDLTSMRFTGYPRAPMSPRIYTGAKPELTLFNVPTSRQLQHVQVGIAASRISLTFPSSASHDGRQQRQSNSQTFHRPSPWPFAKQSTATCGQWPRPPPPPSRTKSSLAS